MPNGVWDSLISQGPLVLLMLVALWALVAAKWVYTKGYVEQQEANRVAQLSEQKERYEQLVAQLREQYEARLAACQAGTESWKALAQESGVNLAAITRLLEANELAEWERERGQKRPPPPLRPRERDAGGSK